MKKEYCDLCGRESNTKSMRIRIAKAAERLFDVCQMCENDLSRSVMQAQIDFIHSTKWWEENRNDEGDIDYGRFEMVGTAEQGGYVCPKCGHSNNAYTFDGKCQACGYKNERLRRY